jgi:iron complex outermembrane recepter protein
MGTRNIRQRRSITLRTAITTLLLAAAASPSALAQTSAQPRPRGELEEIVVTGVRESLQNAQEIKRASLQVVDSIVAEDVGKLPDNNVAEALARVTGIQIRRDSGEANTVLIRGLPNIVTLLNGREVFTTRDRFIRLNDIPSNMLQRVDVYKTNASELIEGGLAGTIDVRTRHPFDDPGLQINANARGIYSDKSDAINPNLGVTVSNTWDTGAGDFGALAGVSYQRRNYHEERAFNVAPEPQAGQFNPAHPAPVANFKGPFVVGQIPIAGDRRRAAVNFALEWRPNERARLYAEGFGSQFDDDFELDFFVGLPFLGNGDISATVFPGTNQMKTLTNHDVFTITSTQANDQRITTKQFAVGGSFETENNLTFSTDISRTTSHYTLVNPILDVSTIVPEVFVDTNHDGTVLMRYGGPNYNIKDGSTYFLENFFDNHGSDDGEAFDVRADVAWTPDSGVLTELGAGLRYADRDAESIRSFLGGTGVPPVRVAANSIPGLAGLSEPMASGGPRYDLRQWYTPSASFLLDHTDVIRTAFGKTKRALDPGSFFSDNEVTKTLYVQAKFAGEIGSMDWGAVLGVRGVRTEQELGGNSSRDVGGGNLVYTPVTAQNESTDYLPTASFKLSLTPELIGRVAVGRTLTRPNFVDLNPGVSLSTVVSNTTALTGSSGNPNLKPVTSDYVDFSMEWYFDNAGSLTAAAFGRKFDGYVQPSFINQTFGGQNYRITRPGNTGSGELKGVELGYQQFYDFLPGILGGLGLQANVTYVDGQTEDINTGRDRTITGVSDWTYNIIGLYEKDRWSGRLAYNWRSKFVDTYAFAANATGEYDIFVAPTAQMDGSISFDLNDNLTLSFEVVNILDTEFKDYFNDSYLYPRDTRRYDRTYELGFRASF